MNIFGDSDMITSVSNSRVKQVIGLCQKAKVRNENDLFLVEGLKLFLEAPKERVREVFVSESFYAKYKEKEILETYKYEVVADEVFRKMTDTVHPQGILCTVAQYHYTVEDLIQTENPLLVVLENLQDPGNLGTILRTGEGAGIDGVILTKDSVDMYNPKTIRSTMGSIYRVPFVYVDSLHSLMDAFREKDIMTYAAHLQGTSYFTDGQYTKGTAFFIGNESKGLSDYITEKTDAYVKIPMLGKVESLNAGIAASLFMYEARRQRSL